jgi:hypothetical protein
VNVFFRILGVDYVQWWAVSRTLARTDFRLPMTEGRSALGRIGGFVSMALVLGLFGSGAAVIVVFASDPLWSTTLILTYLSVMLLTTLMTQHGMTMLSTADLAILGPRPVSSRTFLAIRVTNVLFHALVVTSLMAYPVIIAYAVAHQFQPMRAVIAAVAIYTWACGIALALVASYGSLLRLLGAARFRRGVGYLQLAAGFLSYGGLLIASRFMNDGALSSASLPDRWWLLLVPPAWFASYLELAAGAPNSTTYARASLSLIVMVALLSLLRGKLGVEYARHLADLPQVAEEGASRGPRTPFFGHGEKRAAAILVLAHFKHDLRVRMGILAVAPLIALYLFIGSDSSLDLVAMAVLLFPAILTRHFASSDTPAAAWIYRATPVDRARLIIAVKDIAVVYFVVPFLCVVAAVFAWRIGDPWQAVLHTLFLGVLSHIALQAAMFMSPRLPFALPPDKTTESTSLIGWMLVIIVGGQAALAALDRWVYISNARTLITLIALVGCAWALDRAIAWRVRGLA